MVCHMCNPMNTDRIQKPQHKIKLRLTLGPTKMTTTSRHHQSTSELGDMATMAVSPTNGERQDSCSFRTRLHDDMTRNDELDDITYPQPTALLGRTPSGNPHISPSDMLFPTTPIAENITTPVQLTPVSESNDPMSFSFVTLEEFEDTEMVDAMDENSATPKNTRKIKSSFSTAAWSHQQKRVAKFTLTPRTPRLGPQQCQGTGSMEEGEISDDWSLITEADMARIPVYRQNTFMDMKQSVQAYLLRRAMSKARAARRRMHTIQQSCRRLFQSTLEQRNYVGPTKCISVGSAW